MTNNAYIDALRNSKINPVKLNSSPKRQVFENQKGRCYMCEKSLGNDVCHYAVVEGPDMKTNIPSKEMRAICPACYFRLGPNPVKVIKKKEEKKEKPKKEKTGSWLDEIELND